MQLIGKSTIPANTLIPFNTPLTNWATAGSADLVSFDPTINLFLIPHASSNDYYIHWYIELKTMDAFQLPILSLEISYNQTTRSDRIIAPMKTIQIGDSSLYHIKTVSADDILTIGLKVIGPDGTSYFLDSDSPYNIVATIIILGL